MGLPDGGERPKTLLDWLYKLSWLLILACFYVASLYISGNYVSKASLEKMRAEDRIELGNERKGVEERQTTIIKQQQDILYSLTEVKTRMETNKTRDDAITDLKQKLETLQTYVYTHPGH